MGSMTAGILSFAENRILDDFQSLGVVRSSLSCFLFFSCLILFALFVLLGALKFLQLFVISYALYSDPADSWCGAWKGSDWLTWPLGCGSAGHWAERKAHCCWRGKYLIFLSSLLCSLATSSSSRLPAGIFAQLIQLFIAAESCASLGYFIGRCFDSWRGIRKAPKAVQCKRKKSKEWKKSSPTIWNLLLVNVHKQCGVADWTSVFKSSEAKKPFAFCCINYSGYGRAHIQPNQDGSACEFHSHVPYTLKNE